MTLKISLRAKAGVPKTLVKQKRRLHSLYFLQNTLVLTESCGEFSDLHSIFRLRTLRYHKAVLCSGDDELNSIYVQTKPSFLEIKQENLLKLGICLYKLHINIMRFSDKIKSCF